jgi:hypothetical protein
VDSGNSAGISVSIYDEVTGERLPNLEDEDFLKNLMSFSFWLLQAKYCLKVGDMDGNSFALSKARKLFLFEEYAI